MTIVQQKKVKQLVFIKFKMFKHTILQVFENINIFNWKVIWFKVVEFRGYENS